MIDHIKLLIEQGIVDVCNPGQTLVDEQRYRQTQSRFVDLVQWSITGKCNLRCRHCFMEAPNAKYGELSTKECLRIVDQLDEANVGRVSITGGEPFVRKDFLHIIDSLQAKEIILAQLYTNGVLLNDAMLTEFERRQSKPTLILSFDGIGTHDWVRGLSGTEKRVIDVITRAVEAGFQVSIETAVYKENLDRLMATYDLMQNLGVVAWKVSAMANAGAWRREGGHRDASQQALFDTYLELAAHHHRDGAPFELALGGLYYGPKGSSLWMSPFNKFSGQADAAKQTACQSCRLHPYIMADGRLLPCIPMTGSLVEQDMPRLTETTLSRALRGSAYFDRIDTRLDQVFANNRGCRSCAHRFKCGGGCRAAAMTAGTDYFGADPDACFFFRNGYDEKLARKLKSSPASPMEIAQARHAASLSKAPATSTSARIDGGQPPASERRTGIAVEPPTPGLPVSSKARPDRMAAGV
ncbi:radical SAM/SPASM domain-containing protein [Thiorhodovibrio frisius]|uniref:radical SAM/SPASM domain-containing protein n=1 Tax=Thiorhodovibrio frisius TaxID=631362 RepID=UPI002B259D5B|nr:radical SAM protein [Thiorhodovibrio frisius]